MDIRPASGKKEVLDELLEHGMALIALDGRAPGVDIPQTLRGDMQLRLNLSYRFGLPLEVTDWGVCATLTFGGSQYPCRIPWTAVFLMVSHATGQPYLFPDDMPRELLQAATEETPPEDIVPPPRSATVTPLRVAPSAVVVTTPRPKFTVISTDESETPPPPPPPRDQTRRNHLRVVK